MRFMVGKLIRDNLPAMMRADGLRVFEHRLDDAAYGRALREKLLEEAGEAARATSAELVAELADVVEVARALATAHGLRWDDVEVVRLEKRAQRGGFDGRIFNAAVEADDGLAAAAYYLARPEQYPRED